MQADQEVEVRYSEAFAGLVCPNRHAIVKALEALADQYNCPPGEVKHIVRLLDDQVLDKARERGLATPWPRQATLGWNSIDLDPKRVEGGLLEHLSLAVAPWPETDGYLLDVLPTHRMKTTHRCLLDVMARSIGGELCFRSVIIEVVFAAGTHRVRPQSRAVIDCGPGFKALTGVFKRMFPGYCDSNSSDQQAWPGWITDAETFTRFVASTHYGLPLCFLDNLSEDSGMVWPTTISYSGIEAGGLRIEGTQIIGARSQGWFDRSEVKLGFFVVPPLSFVCEGSPTGREFRDMTRSLAGGLSKAYSTAACSANKK